MNTRKIRQKRIFWWAVFGLWLVLTVYLSSQNGSGSSDVSSWLAAKLWRASNAFTRTMLDRGISYSTFHFYIRKLAHFTVHLVLAFVTVRAAAWSFATKKDALRFAFALTVFLALFDEAIQLAAPGRTSAVLDGAINLSGVLVGLFISSRFGPKALPRIT